METNFFGPHRLIRAALPGFRARKAGTIVNITSIAGIDGLPSCGLYAASKFALEGIPQLESWLSLLSLTLFPTIGLSESLARESASSNVSVLIIEPGGFRTNFLSAFVSARDQGHHYPAVEAALDKFSDFAGNQPGDPKKAADRIVEVVTGKGMAGRLKGNVLRIPLGKDCVERFEAKVRTMSEDLEKAREIAGSTDL